jgi:hypothetical protein
VNRIISLAVVGTVVAATAASLWLAGPAGAAAHPAVSGTEHFQIMTTSPTASAIPVIAYGMFTVPGTDHTGRKADTLVFGNGSFRVNHPGISTKQTFNPKTCLLTVTGSGPATLSGGTGAYRGINGNLTATISVVAIAARTSTGKCSTAELPRVFQDLIKASGKVTL